MRVNQFSLIGAIACEITRQARAVSEPDPCWDQRQWDEVIRAANMIVAACSDATATTDDRGLA